MSRPITVNSSDGVTGQVAVLTITCRRSRSLVPHGVSFGSPPVVGELNACNALQQENDDWSRERAYVYESDINTPFRRKPFTLRVACRLSLRSPEPIAYTLP